MGDPYACFGGSSSSSDDGDSSTNERHPTTEASSANLEAGRRLRDASNEGPVGMTYISDKSFEIFDSRGAGKGIRANVPYKRGDEIMREGAAVVLRNRREATSLEAAEALHTEAVKQAFDKMHPTTKIAFMQLSSCNEDGDGVEKTPRGIYDTNSFRLEGKKGDDYGGLFLTIARMNHSCRPNVTHFWREDLLQTVIFAARDIDAGEELCTTYGPSSCMDTASRRQYLRDRFSFECGCQMCVEGNASGGDDRMVRIQSLQEEIAMFASLGAGPDAPNTKSAQLETVTRCLDLMKKQGIDRGAYTKAIYHAGHMICTAAGDAEGAKEYLQNELVAVRDSEGDGSPKAIEIESIFRRMLAAEA